MKQINVETASREQLIDFIRRMYPQLLREQERVKELESQIGGLQVLIQDKNAETRELRQQSDRLTEKSASDEETIAALIRQMEETRREYADTTALSRTTSSPTEAALRGTGREKASGKGHASSDKVGSDHLLDTVRQTDIQSAEGTARRSSRSPKRPRDGADATLAQLQSQNVAAASTIASKVEEIAKLETKLRELMEVNAFYSAIVAQHDQEEKTRLGQAFAQNGERQEEDVTRLQGERDRLQLRIYDLEEQEEKLQRILRSAEVEKAVLKQENVTVKGEAVQLEAEMEEMTRAYARARRSLTEAASRCSASPERRLHYADEQSTSQLRAGSTSQQGLFCDHSPRVSLPFTDSYSLHPDQHPSYSGVAGSAPRVSPLSNVGSRGAVKGETWATEAAHPSSASSSTRFSFRSLRPIRMRNPDAHEKELLDRIHLYEARFAQMELYETDRQRSFDEMERNRAEMFVAMNGQLEKQRKEIHRLHRLHENASLDSSTTARPSRCQSVASLVHREDAIGRDEVRRHASRSPDARCLTAVPTSTNSLRGVDSTNDVEDAGGAQSGSSSCRRGDNAVFTSKQVLVEEELQLHETEARLALCEEGLFGLLDIAAALQIATAAHVVRELEECQMKVLGEHEVLTAELEAQQQRIGYLEAALALSTDMQAASLEVTRVESPVSASVAVSVADVLEGKAWDTALTALEARGALMEHWSTFLRHTALPHSGREAESESSDNFAEEVVHDMAEVHAMLDALQRELLAKLSVGVDVSAVVTAQAGDEEVTTPASLEASIEALVETLAGEVADTEPSHGSASLSRASSAPLSPHQTSLANGASDLNAPALEVFSAVNPATPPPELVDPEETSPARPLSATEGSTHTEEASKISSDSALEDEKADTKEDSSAVSDDGPHTSNSPLMSPAEEQAGMGCTPSLVEAASTTSPFVDCIEKDDDTRRTSVEPETEEEEEADGFNSVTSAPDSEPEVQPAGESTESVGHQSQGPVLGVDDAESAHPPNKSSRQAGTDAEEDVEGCYGDEEDGDTIGTTAELDVLAGEEAEFLAQLEKEMGQDAAVATVVGTPEEDEEINICGEEGGDDVGLTTPQTSQNVSSTMSPMLVPAAAEEAKEEEKEEAVSPVVDGDDISESISSNSSPEDVRGVSREQGEANAHDGAPANGQLAGRGGEVESSLSSSTSDSSSVLSVGGGGQDKPLQMTQSAAVGVFPRTVAVLAPSHGIAPDMIPPASLDELFGGVAHPAPASPSLSGVANNSTAPFRAPTTPSMTLSPPVQELPIDARWQDNGTVPAAKTVGSPNSRFGTPPRPVSPGSYFSWSPSAGPQLPPSHNRKGTRSSSASSSSGDFEAGFDPFA